MGMGVRSGADPQLRSPRGLTALLTVLATLAGLLALAPPAAAEAGDAFASAAEVSFQDHRYYASGNTATATLEPGEIQPACAAAADSTWWKVTVGTRVMVSAETDGLDTVLDVVTGTAPDALSSVACSDAAYNRAAVVLMMQPNTT